MENSHDEGINDRFGDELFENLVGFFENVDAVLNPQSINENLERVLSTLDLSVQIGQLLLKIKESLLSDAEDIKSIENIIQCVSELNQLIYKRYQQYLYSDCTIVVKLDFNDGISSILPGRPKVNIPKSVLIELRSLGFSWNKISKIFQVSRWTIYRRIREFNLEELQMFSNISDDELDQIITEYISRHGPTTGEPILSGYLRSKGYTVQRRRIRSSINRVDPKNTALRWGALVTRRTYYVPWPNSLWHIDGHHSLIRWKFVVHGCVDGKSRKIMFLKCSDNNKAETVLQHFLLAINENNNLWPSRIRVDYGVENVLICEAMVEQRGENRGSFIAGSSTRNQRIERLWRDVFRCVLVSFYYTFYALEQSGLLHFDNEIEMYALHYVFSQRINFALEEFKNSYNNHKLSTERNWTPNQIWVNGMMDIENPLSINTVDDVPDNFDIYGEDLQGPYPLGEENNVVVDPIEINFQDEIRNNLESQINANEESDQLGIDVYLKTVSHISRWIENFNNI